MRSPILENVTTTWPTAAGFYGDPDLPFYRLQAVGGDSGNGIYLEIKDFSGSRHTVIYSTQHTPFSGPFISGNRSAIEAAMADMGGSIHTSLTAVDLTGWTNYDAGANFPDY